MKDEDFIEDYSWLCRSLLCFSTRGRLCWLKLYRSFASRSARGRPIDNILPLEENERITAILPIKEFEEGKFVLMAT